MCLLMFSSPPRLFVTQSSNYVCVDAVCMSTSLLHCDSSGRSRAQQVDNTHTVRRPIMVRQLASLAVLGNLSVVLVWVHTDTG